MINDLPHNAPILELGRAEREREEHRWSWRQSILFVFAAAAVLWVALIWGGVEIWTALT